MWTSKAYKLSKVELALIDNIEKEYRKIQAATDEIRKEEQRLGKLIFEFRDVFNNYSAPKFIGMISEAQKAAKDLGIDIDSKYQKAFDDYISAKKQAERFVRR